MAAELLSCAPTLVCRSPSRESGTKGNADFRRVLYTDHHLQLVLMTLPPGGEIGSEVQKDRDQFFRVEAGDGEISLDPRRWPLRATR